jgi:hypothetical protein
MSPPASAYSTAPIEGNLFDNASAAISVGGARLPQDTGPELRKLALSPLQLTARAKAARSRNRMLFARARARVVALIYCASPVYDETNPARLPSLAGF